MSEPLNNKELELFRTNFVENLKEPMRGDFRRVVDTIAELERQLAEVREKINLLREFAEVGCADLERDRILAILGEKGA